MRCESVIRNKGNQRRHNRRQCTYSVTLCCGPVTTDAMKEAIMPGVLSSYKIFRKAVNNTNVNSGLHVKCLTLLFDFNQI